MKYYPLRPIQRWLVDTHFNKAKSTMMNIGGLYKLSASIDMNHLADAINHVLESEDVFHCRFIFHPETSDLCQIFDGAPEHVFVERMSEKNFQRRMEGLREPYYLINRPLYRIYIMQTPNAKYLYVDFYHAIMDGVASAYLFVKAVDAAYRGQETVSELRGIRRRRSENSARRPCRRPRVLEENACPFRPEKTFAARGCRRRRGMDSRQVKLRV